MKTKVTVQGRVSIPYPIRKKFNKDPEFERVADRLQLEPLPYKPKIHAGL